MKPGYAKFEVVEPALNFTLNQGERTNALGAFNHAGIQVDSTDDVLRARARLVEAGLATFDEMDTTCCYAKQDKIWVTTPTAPVGGLRGPRGRRGSGAGPESPCCTAACCA